MKTINFSARLLLIGLLAFVLSSSLNAAEEVKKEVRSIPEFSVLHLKCSADVYITQGNEVSVKVVADESIISYIVTEVQDDALIIDIKKNNLNNIKTCEVYITTKSLSKIQSKGSGNIYCKEAFKGKDMMLELSGSGDVDLVLDAQNLEINVLGSGNVKIKGVGGTFESILSGSGDIEASNLHLERCHAKVHGSGNIVLSGKTNELVVGVNGSGNFNASELVAVEVSASSAGSGDILIQAVEKLDVLLNGSGDLKYLGNPEDVRINGNGSGEVYKR